MLRKGQIVTHQVMIAIRLVMLAVILLLGFVVAKAAYDAVIKPDRQDLAQLALRAEYLVLGSYETPREGQELALGANYASTLFLVQGEGDRAIVVFTEDGQVLDFSTTITVSVPGTPREGVDSLDGERAVRYTRVPYENPCDGPCICEVRAGEKEKPSKRQCVPLRFRGVEIVRIADAAEQEIARYGSPRNWTEEELYGFTFSGARYQHVYIPIGLPYDPAVNPNPKGQRQVILYLEYFPGTRTAAGEQTRPTLLITPYNDALRERKNFLILCPDDSQPACVGRPRDRAIPDTSFFCAYDGSTCALDTPGDCAYGKITDTCLCKEHPAANVQARNDGVCVVHGPTEEYWYSEESINCKEVRSCEDYCTSCTPAQEHACIVDYCGTGASCHVKNGGCTSDEYQPFRLIEEAVRSLAAHTDPGYYYTVVHFPRMRDRGIVVTDSTVADRVNIPCPSGACFCSITRSARQDPNEPFRLQPDVPCFTLDNAELIQSEFRSTGVVSFFDAIDSQSDLDPQRAYLLVDMIVPSIPGEPRRVRIDEYTENEIRQNTRRYCTRYGCPPFPRDVEHDDPLFFGNALR